MKDIAGQKFGRLTVISRAENTAAGSARWHCECDCGRSTVSIGSNLRRGGALSCGCIGREKAAITAAVMGAATRVHGSCDEPEYRVWGSMIARCENPKNPQYKNYGARGVRICDAWRNSYAQFIQDVGKRPSKDLSLDRIKNDLGYEPGNVRWATYIEQNNNKRDNVIVSLGGSEMTFAEAVRSIGVVKYGVARQRVVRDGWSLEDALCVPV